MAKVLESGAALGVASLVISTAALLNGHAPSLPKVRANEPGSPVASDLRLAELSTAAWVVGAGAVASLAVRERWPLLLSLAAVGVAIGVYELSLRTRGPRASDAA